MPVSLVAPKAQGSFWVVLRGLIMVHFGGPWTEQDKALYVVQLARGENKKQYIIDPEESAIVHS